MAHMLLGMLAHRKGLQEKAQRSYEEAVELAPDNMQAKYNYALLLLDMGKQQQAERLAEEVYATGFPLEGLKRRLSERGSYK
jgi:Flp pilus assembly protein TadD